MTPCFPPPVIFLLIFPYFISLKLKFCVDGTRLVSCYVYFFILNVMFSFPHLKKKIGIGNTAKYFSVLGKVSPKAGVKKKTVVKILEIFENYAFLHKYLHEYQMYGFSFVLVVQLCTTENTSSE